MVILKLVKWVQSDLVYPLYICIMEIWDCSNQEEKIATVLNGKTILKFKFLYSIEFTDGKTVEFDLGDDSWHQEITYYDAGEKR
jgi:hypothetical protein